MQIKMYQVDAFTDRLFGGNPAGVCPLDAWLPDATMQAIAAENNVAETAFFVPEGDNYALRWFTPTVEVDLCGHATLASAFVIFERLAKGKRQAAFRTMKAGTLTVVKEGDLLSMDFPARAPEPTATDPALVAALGKAPLEMLVARDHMVIYERAADVVGLAPDFKALGQLKCWGVIATAPGENGVDFVSRFFAPSQGIDEDPATGSSHCTLTPYWAEKLGKSRLEARQLSKRGGALTCTLRGDRVDLAGRAVLYLEGMVSI